MNKKKPVFMYFYIPNHRFSIELQNGVEDASKLYSDKVSFIKVNCKINQAFCKNTPQVRLPDGSNKLAPSAELLFPFEEEPQSSIMMNAPFLQKQMQKQ